MHQIIALLGIKPGSCIANLGSGGGFFTFKFAEMTGYEGVVYAVDIHRNNLDYLFTQAAKKVLGISKQDNLGERSPSPRRCRIYNASHTGYFIPDSRYDIWDSTRIKGHSPCPCELLIGWYQHSCRVHI